jgi:hypothetical protein
MIKPSDRKLLQVPSGDSILPHRWVALPGQPLYAAAVADLRRVEYRISTAQHAGDQDEINRLQADRVEAETKLIRTSERLHLELHELLWPAVTSFVRYTLNTLQAFMRWKTILAGSRDMVLSTGFNLGALPQRLTIESMVSCDMKSVFAVLLAEAQAGGVITGIEASQLLAGQQLAVSFPAADS